MSSSELSQSIPTSSSPSTGTARRSQSRMKPPPLNNRSNTSIVRNSLLAGSVAGMASTLLMYPADLLRTKLQASGIQQKPSSIGSSPMQVLRHTLQHGGIRALYTGMSLPLAAQAVYKGTVFTVNNVTERIILDLKALQNHKRGIIEPAKLNMYDRFCCGFVGGAVNALLFVTPVEFVRNQLIAQHSKLSTGQHVKHVATGSLDVIRYSMQQYGWRSLWRGASWSVARDSIGCGCFFVTMSWTQQALVSTLTSCGHRRRRNGEPPSLAVAIVSGGLAGLSFWVVSLPLDTVKTWVQSSDLATSPVSASSSVQKILQRDGLPGVVRTLFRGWQVAYGRGIPSSAITISIYLYVYHHLQGNGSST